MNIEIDSPSNEYITDGKDENTSKVSLPHINKVEMMQNLKFGSVKRTNNMYVSVKYVIDKQPGRF